MNRSGVRESLPRLEVVINICFVHSYCVNFSHRRVVRPENNVRCLRKWCGRPKPSNSITGKSFVIIAYNLNVIYNNFIESATTVEDHDVRRERFCKIPECPRDVRSNQFVHETGAKTSRDFRNFEISQVRLSQSSNGERIRFAKSIGLKNQ